MNKHVHVTNDVGLEFPTSLSRIILRGSVELLSVELVLVEIYEFTTSLLPVVEVLLIGLLLVEIYRFTTSLIPSIELLLLNYY